MTSRDELPEQARTYDLNETDTRWRLFGFRAVVLAEASA